MGRRRGSPFSSGQVKAVERQVTHWRRTRRKRSPMPPALWDAVVSLARTHGVYGIARALGLSYGTLKQRVEQRPGGGLLGRREESGFVEVPAAELVTSFESASTVVEFSGWEGAKLVIRLRDDDRLDVLRLADGFWKRRA